MYVTKAMSVFRQPSHRLCTTPPPTRVKLSLNTTPQFRISYRKNRKEIVEILNRRLNTGGFYSRISLAFFFLSQYGQFRAE